MRELANVIKPESSTKRDGLLIGVVGPQGSGKSLTMTYLGLSRLAFYNDPLYSNYNLYGNFKYFLLDKKEDVFDELDTIYNSTLLIDEFNSYISSYKWRDPKVQDFIAKKMVIARRRGNYYLMGNQRLESFPKALRSIMPCWIFPYIKRRKIIDGKKAPYIVEFRHINKMTGVSKREKFKASLVMGCYDTWENFDHLLINEDDEKNRVDELSEIILEEEMEGTI